MWSSCCDLPKCKFHGFLSQTWLRWASCLIQGQVQHSSCILYKSTPQMAVARFLSEVSSFQSGALPVEHSITMIVIEIFRVQAPNAKTQMTGNSASRLLHAERKPSVSPLRRSQPKVSSRLGRLRLLCFGLMKFNFLLEECLTCQHHNETLHQLTANPNCVAPLHSLWTRL